MRQAVQKVPVWTSAKSVAIRRVIGIDVASDQSLRDASGLRTFEETELPGYRKLLWLIDRSLVLAAPSVYKFCSLSGPQILGIN
jgi:hypothetical protein